MEKQIPKIESMEYSLRKFSHEQVEEARQLFKNAYVGMKQAFYPTLGTN